MQEFAEYLLHIFRHLTRKQRRLLTDTLGDFFERKTIENGSVGQQFKQERTRCPHIACGISRSPILPLRGRKAEAERVAIVGEARMEDTHHRASVPEVCDLYIGRRQVEMGQTVGMEKIDTRRNLFHDRNRPRQRFRPLAVPNLVQRAPRKRLRRDPKQAIGFQSPAVQRREGGGRIG